MWSTNKQRFLLWIEGDYLNNKKEGTGIFWWTTGSHAGDRYEGQFEDDKRLKHYFIELFHNLKLMSITSQFYSISNKNHNFRHGNGMYRYSNGDIYDGSWANGNQEGEGLLLYASGNRLEG